MKARRATNLLIHDGDGIGICGLGSAQEAQQLALPELFQLARFASQPLDPTGWCRVSAECQLTGMLLVGSSRQQLQPHRPNEGLGTHKTFRQKQSSRGSLSMSFSLSSSTINCRHNTHQHLTMPPPLFDDMQIANALRNEALPALERLAQSSSLQDRALARFDRAEPPPYVSSTEDDDEDMPYPHRTLPRAKWRMH
jgi:hypothetical protein